MITQFSVQFDLVVFSLSLKVSRDILHHGIGKVYGTFRTSLVITAIRVMQTNLFAPFQAGHTDKVLNLWQFTDVYTGEIACDGEIICRDEKGKSLNIFLEIQRNYKGCSGIIYHA